MTNPEKKFFFSSTSIEAVLSKILNFHWRERQQTKQSIPLQIMVLSDFYHHLCQVLKQVSLSAEATIDPSLRN